MNRNREQRSDGMNRGGRIYTCKKILDTENRINKILGERGRALSWQNSINRVYTQTSALLRGSKQPGAAYGAGLRFVCYQENLDQ